MAQLTEDGTAEQAPEPVARDVAEQCAKPLSVQAEVHDPGGDVDEVLCVPITSSTSCHQEIFVDQATDLSLSLDAVLVEVDRFG